jgi:hypothetical protein
MSAIIDLTVGQIIANGLTRIGINPDMQLAPGAAFLSAMFSLSHSPAPRSFKPVLSTIR